MAWCFAMLMAGGGCGASDPSGRPATMAPGTSGRQSRSAALATSATPVQAVPMGVNVDVNGYLESTMLWVNVAHQMKAWGQPGSFGTAYTGPLSSHGYPLQDSDGAMQLAGYANGTYTVSWTGHATVNFAGMAYAVSNPVTVGGVTTVRVNADRTLAKLFVIQLRQISSTNPLDNLTIIPPGYDSTQMFSPSFLQKVATFNTVRCMDLFGTNNSPLVNFSDRPTLQSSIWTSNTGIPYEAAINLANLQGQNLWVNVPAQATDDFVHQMARLFAANINPSATIYLEYSNELWNSQFSQSKYVLAQAQANPSLSGPPLVIAAQQSALRLKQIADIWRQEFGSAQAQVKPVLGGQLANSSWGQNGLTYIQNTFGPPAQYFAALAVAPYVGGQITETTLDQLFLDLNSSLTGSIIPKIAQNGQVAQQFGLPLYAYEGGQGLVCFKDATKLSLLTGAQSDPRMGQLYLQLYKGWYGNQGNLFMHYTLSSTPSTFGAWGLLQTITDTGSQKWNATLQVLQNGP